uniref:Copper transporter n=2 Tax=Fagus sylvatica TaxID=28930 RepID=A0A2N9J552_FAGSY
MMGLMVSIAIAFGSLWIHGGSSGYVSLGLHVIGIGLMHDNPILGAMRGGAVRERGGISCPDHRGGAGSGIGSTCAGRVRVTHDPVPIRPVPIPSGEPRVMVGCALQLGYGYKIGFNLL